MTLKWAVFITQCVVIRNVPCSFKIICFLSLVLLESIFRFYSRRLNMSCFPLDCEKTRQQVMYSSLQWEAAAEWCFSIRAELVLRRNARAPPLRRHGESLFPYSSPSLDFQHHHAHHYRCQKLRAEYELSVIGGPVAGAARGEPVGGGVTRRCRCLNSDRPWRGEDTSPSRRAP